MVYTMENKSVWNLIDDMWNIIWLLGWNVFTKYKFFFNIFTFQTFIIDEIKINVHELIFLFQKYYTSWWRWWLWLLCRETKASQSSTCQAIDYEQTLLYLHNHFRPIQQIMFTRNYLRFQREIILDIYYNEIFFHKLSDKIMRIEKMSMTYF